MRLTSTTISSASRRARRTHNDNERVKFVTTTDVRARPKHEDGSCSLEEQGAILDNAAQSPTTSGLHKHCLDDSTIRLVRVERQRGVVL